MPACDVKTRLALARCQCASILRRQRSATDGGCVVCVCSVARIIAPGGQASTTSFRVLSANPGADLRSDAEPAMIVDGATRRLPWTLDAESQSIPDR